MSHKYYAFNKFITALKIGNLRLLGKYFNFHTKYRHYPRFSQSGTFMHQGHWMQLIKKATELEQMNSLAYLMGYVYANYQSTFDPLGFQCTTTKIDAELKMVYEKAIFFLLYRGGEITYRDSHFITFQYEFLNKIHEP